MKKPNKEIYSDNSLLRVEIAGKSLAKNDNDDDCDESDDSQSCVSKGDNMSHCSEGIFMLLSNNNNQTTSQQVL